MRKIWITALALAMATGACAHDARPPITGADVRSFEADQPHPPIERTLGPVSAYACHRSDRDKAGAGLALSRLLERAAKLGATAVVDLKYGVSDDGPRSPCWKRTVVRGTAVIVQPSP